MTGSWLRNDSWMLGHPKWAPLSGDAYKLGHRLLLWANQYSRRTGFVPEGIVREYAGGPAKAARLVLELVNAGQPLHEVGILEPVEGGWRVHDLEKYMAKPEGGAEQPGELSARAAAARVAGLASAQARRERTGSAQPGRSSAAFERGSERRLRTAPNVEAPNDAEPSAGSVAESVSESEPNQDVAPNASNGERPNDSERSLGERAQLWLTDPQRASFDAAHPERWTETDEVVAAMARVFGGKAQAPRTTGDPRMQALLRRWSDGFRNADLIKAIEGSARDAHIKAHPQFQTLHTILRDAAQVDRFAALAEAPETAQVVVRKVVLAAPIRQPNGGYYRSNVVGLEDSLDAAKEGAG